MRFIRWRVGEKRRLPTHGQAAIIMTGSAPLALSSVKAFDAERRGSMVFRELGH
jgi:hypothetical protein